MRPLTQTLLVSVAMICTLAAAPAQTPFNEVIAFGASFTDTGNVHDLTFGRAARSPYFRGRFSNGPVWIEVLAERLGLGTPTEADAVPAPSRANGTNWAYGGAGTGKDYSTTCATIAGVRVCVPDMQLQVEQFLASGAVLDGDELIMVQPSGNDASGTVSADNVARMVLQLAQAGGRHFLVPNFFRIRSPERAERGSYYDNFVEQCDSRLEIDLQIVEQLTGVTIYRLDLLALSDDILARPGHYGFVNIKDPACPGCGAGIPAPNAADTVVGLPNTYLYWDYAHFTARAHAIFGNAAADLVGAPAAMVAPAAVTTVESR